MHRNVEVLIGRLATDPALRRRFAEQPFEALREQGLELTQVEIAALGATDPEAFRAFADALDARLRKASPAAGSHLTDEAAAPSQVDSRKETHR